MLNDGFVIRNWNEKQVEPRQIIILGLPRGGTTMTTNMIKSAGIFIGEDLPITLEDREIARMLTSWNVNQKEFFKLVSQRDNDHKVWGFKFIYRIHFSLLESLKNPYYVIVFRDICSVALRNHITEGVDYLTSMKANLGLQGRIIGFIEETKNPTFLFSYEKALLGPTRISKALLKFLHIPETIEVVNKVASSIEPSQKDYVQLMKKRAKRKARVDIVAKAFRGYVDRIISEHIKGWIFLENDPNQEVSIELYAAEKLVERKIANLVRKGVGEKFSSNGKHGFYFDLPRNNQILDYQMFAVTKGVREKFAVIKLEKT